MINNNELSHDNLKRNELSHNELPNYELAYNGLTKATPTPKHLMTKESINHTQSSMCSMYSMSTKAPLNNSNNSNEESCCSSSISSNSISLNSISSNERSTKRRMSILDKSKLKKAPRYYGIFSSNSIESSSLNSINSFLNSNPIRLIVFGAIIIIWVLLFIDTNVANAIDLHRNLNRSDLKDNNQHSLQSLQSNVSSADACAAKRQEADDLEHKVANKVFNIVTSSVGATSDLNIDDGLNTSNDLDNSNDLDDSNDLDIFNRLDTSNNLNVYASSDVSNTSTAINSLNTEVDTPIGTFVASLKGIDRDFVSNTEQGVDLNSIEQNLEPKNKQDFNEKGIGNQDIDNQSTTQNQSKDNFDEVGNGKSEVVDLSNYSEIGDFNGNAVEGGNSASGVNTINANNTIKELAYTDKDPNKSSNKLVPIDLSASIDSNSSIDSNTGVTFSENGNSTVSGKNKDLPIYNMYRQKSSSFHDVSWSIGAIKASSNVFTYEIAIDDLNRISFPFKSINVNTASDAEIQNENGVLYILPMSEDNISLFITPSSCKDLGILLILKPVKTIAKNIVISPKSSWFMCEARNSSYGEPSINAQKEEALLTFFERLWLAHDYKEFVLTNKDVFILGKEDLEAYEAINICSESFEENIQDAFIWRNYMIFILSIENNIGVSLPITCNKGQKAISYANDSILDAHSKELIFVAYDLSKE